MPYNVTSVANESFGLAGKGLDPKKKFAFLNKITKENMFDMHSMVNSDSPSRLDFRNTSFKPFKKRQESQPVKSAHIIKKYRAHGSLLAGFWEERP